MTSFGQVGETGHLPDLFIRAYERFASYYGGVRQSANRTPFWFRHREASRQIWGVRKRRTTSYKRLIRANA